MSETVILLAFVLPGLGLVLASAALGSTDPARRRRLARSIRGAMHQNAVAPPPGAGLLRHLGGWIRALAGITAERVSVMTGGEIAKSGALLTTAGYRSRDAIFVYSFIKLVLPVATLAVGGAWGVVFAPLESGVMRPLIVVLALTLAASKIPDWLLTQARNRRLDQVRRSFPDMLELLVIVSESGLGPQAALQRVAREIRLTAPILSAELAETVAEMGMTGNRAKALTALADRVPLTEVQVFAQTLTQTERYGTPFAAAMRALIRAQRADRMLRVEEKANRMPALMTIPLIVFIMPALFVVLVGPAALGIVDTLLVEG